MKLELRKQGITFKVQSSQKNLRKYPYVQSHLIYSINTKFNL